MWESPIYKFEEETTEKGKIVKKPFHINVTYSAPRNLDDPKKALIGVFNKITQGRTPANTHILDVGAAKLRNTLWLLQKGFHVWAVEFPELRDRLADAKVKWEQAERNFSSTFHKVTFPKDFIGLRQKFDIILLINEINVMPIPLERFAMLALCRDKIKADGILLWHQMRAESQEKYSDENQFIDGYLMGNGPNHTFYVEHNKEESHEILYSTGFSWNKSLNLAGIPANGSNYSYVFTPEHDVLIDAALDVNKMIRTTRDPSRIMAIPDKTSVLNLYIEELRHLPVGRDEAHKYHLIASRIFYEIFRNQLNEPIIEREINDRRGRIDISYKNRNKEGIFKNLKDLRDIPCPEIMVECKNYKNDLTNNEYAQLADRLLPQRGMLGFLLCRDKQKEAKVLEHCKDRHKGGANKYIIVLDDKDLVTLAGLVQSEEDDAAINDFVEEKVKAIVD